MIVISSRFPEDSPEYRTILAHELGHHFTAMGDVLPYCMYSYSGQLDTGRAENRANRWAADQLIPWTELSRAVRAGVTERWELAEYFGVTEELVGFRLRQI